MAACVNMFKIRSIYTWKGGIEDAEEILSIYKTSGERSGDLKLWIEENHLYEVSEVIELTSDQVSRRYLEWLITSVK